MPAIFGTLDRDLYLAYLAVGRVFDRSEILTDRASDVLQRLVLGCTLGPAAWKAGAGHRVAFFAVMEHDPIPHRHRHRIQLLRDENPHSAVLQEREELREMKKGAV